MGMPTPQQAANNWARGLANSTEKIRQGIQGVTESPMEKAASRADAYAQGVQRAVSEGKYQSGLRSVSLDEWKRQSLEKGVNRIAGGAEASKGKMASFLTEFLPFVQQGMAQLPPRGTVEQNIERSVQMMRHNSKFRRRG